jgi:DNA-binding response OmpR family regulator
MNTMRVLIADRDEDLLESYGRFLASRDVKASLVTNGLNCIEQIRVSPPDVLVLAPGLLWGGTDGVLEWMYGEWGLPEVPPVILLAGGSEADQLYRVLEFPIDEFLVKPVSPRTLLKRIRWVHYGRGPNALFKLSWPQAAKPYERENEAVGQFG